MNCSGDKVVKSGSILMYTGEYNHTIDNKGRMIVPAKFREALGESFMVTRGVGNCLEIYDMEEWERYVSKLREMTGEASTMKMIRFKVSGAHEVDIDKQGRTLIPVNLREWAGLEKDVVLAGMIGHIEVWTKAKWDEINTFDDMSEISEELAKKGLGF